jgi:E3 ubiquitin-protein ligase RNF14
MEDEPHASEDERTIELSTIAAIYPEIVVDENDPYTATLELSVTPVQPLRILFRPSTDTAPPAPPTPPTSSEQGKDGTGNKPVVQQTLPLDDHELSHLPPLSLRITLPEDYPATKPPIVSVSVSPQWLGVPAVKRLQDDCARLWEEIGKDQVLYTYIDHVQQEAEQAFGLAGETSVSMPSDLKLALLDFDLKTKRERFEKETFDCGICLEPKKGVSCHKMLQCGHVFCVPCLQDYYNNCITEGDVDNVKCLDPSCGKDEPARTGPGGRPLKRRKRDRTLNPSELLQIPIDQEQVQRYVKLKRKKRLESDKNTVYCPRQWCQGAARSQKHPKPTDPMDESEDTDESESEEGQKKAAIDRETLPMAERLAICEDCDFAFCVVCQKSWHGENARCSPRRQQELNEEERATAEYFQKFSTPCPTCNAPAQKTMGCNHMTCFKCKTHFCYLCASYLMPENPYRHYNDTSSPCYMKLWVLEEGDGEGVDRGAFHNPDVVAEWEAAAAAEDSDEEDELPPENFAAFRGQRPFADEEDTDDEEPAPDQRRNRNVIEIVMPGQNAQRIELPERPREAPVPPQAPIPPRRGRRRRGGGQLANRQRAMANEPARINRGQGQARARAGQPAAR